MVSLFLLPLIIAIIAFGSFDVGALQIGCSKRDERCLPIRHCTPVLNRYQSNEHINNDSFKFEISRKLCEPATRMKEGRHICCSKREIGCFLHGKPGVCLQREKCPTLRSTTEQQLMSSFNQSLCYVHDAKKYFCCTDPLCTAIKELCDREPSTQQRRSAYQSCTSANGDEGFLVPGKICNDRIGSTRKGDQPVCCVMRKHDQLIAHPKATKLAKLSCGTIGLIDKIQGGLYAQRGELPWMAKLVYSDRLVMCSGTLIHTRYVLTAAHCISWNLRRVQLGLHDVRYTAEVQEISISKSFTHDIYDVGLLRLSRKATLEEGFVQVICLPVYASLRIHLPTMITISGWGQTEDSKFPSVLMKADTRVLMNEKDCSSSYICVGGPKHNNHCTGDSGGPYQGIDTFGGFSGRYVQYGIISEGPFYCSKPDSVSRGVLVSYVIDWILDRMQI